MLLRDLPEAKNTAEVLAMVQDHTIHECALPFAYQQAFDAGLIKWQYAGAWGQDWLVLTNAGRSAVGLPPERSEWDQLVEWFTALRGRRALQR